MTIFNEETFSLKSGLQKGPRAAIEAWQDKNQSTGQISFW